MLLLKSFVGSIKLPILSLAAFATVSNSLTLGSPSQGNYRALEESSNLLDQKHPRPHRVKRQDDGYDGDDDGPTSFTPSIIQSPATQPWSNRPTSFGVTSILPSNAISSQIPANSIPQVAPTSNMNLTPYPNGTPNPNVPAVTPPINPAPPPLAQTTNPPNPPITSASQFVSANPPLPTSNIGPPYSSLVNPSTSFADSRLYTPTAVPPSSLMYSTSIPINSNTLLPTPSPAVTMSNSISSYNDIPSFSSVESVAPADPSGYAPPYPQVNGTDSDTNTNDVSTGSDGGGETNNSGAIAGGVVGGVAAIAILGGLIAYRHRRNKREGSDMASLEGDGHDPSSSEQGFFAKFNRGIRGQSSIPFARQGNQPPAPDGNMRQDVAQDTPSMSMNVNIDRPPNRFDPPGLSTHEPQNNRSLVNGPNSAPESYEKEPDFPESVRSTRSLTSPNRTQPNSITTTPLPSFQNEPVNLKNPIYHKPTSEPGSRTLAKNLDSELNSAMAPPIIANMAIARSHENGVSHSLGKSSGALSQPDEDTPDVATISQCEWPLEPQGNDSVSHISKDVVAEPRNGPPEVPKKEFSSSNSNFDIQNMPGLVKIKNETPRDQVKNLRLGNPSKTSLASKKSAMSEGGNFEEPLEETVIVGFSQSQSTLSSHASEGPAVHRPFSNNDLYNTRLVMTAVSSYMPQRPNELLVLPGDKLMINAKLKLNHKPTLGRSAGNNRVKEQYATKLFVGVTTSL
ncbi:hypothetical protein K493DRAFT_296292 [Basidiobolus meristosporus CBS 931.73]|uniref:SH3 domain-containing protein n=1 Tax=Basidiobolus meristosporus CBS 931.73 TaxID=1314790 RepID=A0A1Y1Z6M1_9FUNG|nr:hypothetical protein K493DRAFT_296292 [Basidiobolus meristosporus CBS 931.73]|eukprot:ORY05890.1 hypothetical protein K493DRAFT_296292 [Basidiobolus meristosporus CBS 931.73]